MNGHTALVSGSGAAIYMHPYRRGSTTCLGRRGITAAAETSCSDRRFGEHWQDGCAAVAVERGESDGT